MVLICLLILTTATVLYLAWFQIDDCAGAMRQTGGQNPELFRSLAPQCAAYEANYTKLKWLSLLALPVTLILWWLPRRGPVGS
ncbi:hypothetical protein D3C80_1041970 [compost metagenome]